MQIQKNKELSFEIRDYPKDISNFYKKITNIDLGEKLPKIHVVDFSQIGLAAGGFQLDNKIFVEKDWEEYGKKVFEGVTYHEFFHWALWKSGLESSFEGRFYIQFYIDHGYNFAVPLRLLLIKDLPQYSAKINSMEEGAAEFFAAKLISKNENEIPKNMFYPYFYENPSTVFQVVFNSISYKRAKKAIKEVYTTYQKLNGLQTIPTIDESLKKAEFQINGLIDKFHKIFPNTIKWEALHDIGRVTVLFAYEIYKKENKNSEDLLKDLIFSTWETVEKVVREIKNDKNGELLKNTISDFEEGFKEHLRDEEKQPSFIQKLATKVEEFKKRIRS
jgi:hypothetical protein